MKFTNFLGFMAIFFIMIINRVEAASSENQEAIRLGHLQIQDTLESLRNHHQNNELMEKALETMLKIATHKMNKLGFNEEAEQINFEWENISAVYFHNSINFLDLGDHAPLSQWLAKTYDKIEQKIGKRYCRWAHLDDIKAINYGFPVSIHPEGDPATHIPWGRPEYLKHFVPFSTAVTYWAGNMACSLALNLVGSLVCSVALEIPRYSVQRFFAPHLGKDIYNRFNN